MVDARVTELLTSPHQHPTSPKTRSCVSHASTDLLGRAFGEACRYAGSRWTR